MKINIGPYREWIGPYQIAEILCFWVDPIKDEYGIDCKPDWVSDFGDFLSNTWVSGACQWVEDQKKRKVKIRIDNYDTWSMDSTLAMIILPMLMNLRVTKRGYPAEFCHEYETYPTEAQMSFDVEGFEIDEDAGAAKWDEVLDEMIWAFEQVNVDWEEQYYSGEIDHKWIAVDRDDDCMELTNGPKHTFEIDMDGMRKHQERMSNAFENFGKYYQSLWN